MARGVMEGDDRQEDFSTPPQETAPGTALVPARVKGPLPGLLARGGAGVEETLEEFRAFKEWLLLAPKGAQAVDICDRHGLDLSTPERQKWRLRQLSATAKEEEKRDGEYVELLVSTGAGGVEMSLETALKPAARECLGEWLAFMQTQIRLLSERSAITGKPSASPDQLAKLMQATAALMKEQGKAARHAAQAQPRWDRLPIISLEERHANLEAAMERGDF